jgi:hypothetical protein
VAELIALLFAARFFFIVSISTIVYTHVSMTQTFIDEDGSQFEAPLIVTLAGRYSVAVASIQEAVSEALQYRDAAQLTQSRYYSVFAGRVFAGRVQVARIHYDGTIEHMKPRHSHD